MVDLKDPIQIHLLTETALTDSKQYEILSQDEVDGLKKQIQAVTQRVESTRSNLLIQSKYRDAAMSMARLYSPTKGDFPPQGADREAEEEREAIQQQCEALAAELFHLEKKLLEPKRRLLEHTAGILQLTHKASKKKGAMVNGQAPNGVPGSPESMYTYTQSRNSLDAPDEFYTDDTNFFGLEGLDTAQGKTRGRNPLEIPLKSPIREQQSQLKDDLDRARDEKNQLMASIAEMERKLASLNGALHETVIRFNPEGNSEFDGPPPTSLDVEPTDLLRSQIEYLESGLVAVQAEQQTLLAAPRALTPVGNVDGTLQELWELIQNGYTDIRQRKEERRRARADKGLEDDEDMSDDDGIDLSETYTPLNFSSRVRWLYRQATVLKDQKSVLKRQIKQQRELNNKSDAEKDAELAQKQEELREKDMLIGRAEKDAMDAQRMLSDALEDLEQARDAASTAMSDQSSANTGKTEELEAKLRDLQRTLQESEADSQSTQKRLAQVDASINMLYGELEETTEAKEQAEARVDDLQAQLAKKQNEIDALNASMAEFSTEIARKQNESDAFNTSTAELSTELARKQAETDALKASVAELKDEVSRKQDEAEALNASITELKNEAGRKQDETDTLNASLVELKTELTIAQAELDGAYGSRAERAADVAAIKTRGEVSGLRSQVDTLKAELSSTVKELEEMAKETIGSEREKVELENKLDEALTTRAALESEVNALRERLEADIQKARDRIAQLQEELDGERLQARRGDGSGRAGTGASMLSEQFRATMREERKKFQEDIKVSKPAQLPPPNPSTFTDIPQQEERARTRKLEEELSKLKRAQGPGKSPLSPR